MNAAAVIEVMLLRWSDNQNGRTVTFLLPDDGGDHPFKGLKCGPSNGDRLAVSVARIADDETQHAVAQPSPSRDSNSTAAGAKQYSLPQRVGMRCSDLRFRKFLVEQDNNEANYIAYDTDRAADSVRVHCGVKSRSEIQPGTEAARKWDALEAKFLAEGNQP
jgi:hypothetical protein